MMERRTQAIMVMLDGLLGDRSGSRNRGANSGEPNREPRVNFNKQPNRRRTYGSTRGRAVHPAMTQDIIGRRAQISEEVIPLARRKYDWSGDSTSWSHADQGRSQPSKSNRSEIPEHLSEANDAEAGHSRDATSMATAFEPLNRSLEIFLMGLPRNSERSEKSSRVF